MYRPLYFQLFFVLLVHIGISCNAQTIAYPKPKAPTLQSLSEAISANSTLKITFFSSNPLSKKQIFPSMETSLTVYPKANLLKVSTIPATHYADTHNAFFCRLERKINKKFVMPVRIRLEGF